MQRRSRQGAQKLSVDVTEVLGRQKLEDRAHTGEALVNILDFHLRFMKSSALGVRTNKEYQHVKNHGKTAPNQINP